MRLDTTVFNVIIVAKLCITTANDNRAILRSVLRFFNVLDSALVECLAPATNKMKAFERSRAFFYFL